MDKGWREEEEEGDGDVAAEERQRIGLKSRGK